MEKIVRDELFLKQYDQVWQQRRQHVGHIWAIPVVITGLLGIFTTLLVYGKINFSSHICLKFLSILVIALGFFGLFCRHNFFIRVLGLLLKDLQSNPTAREDLPQFGTDFRERFKSDLKNPLDRFGSLSTGTFWWFITVAGIILFVVVNWWGQFRGLVMIFSFFPNFFRSEVFWRLVFFVVLCVTSFTKLIETIKQKEWLGILLFVGLFVYTAFYAWGNGQNLIKPLVVLSEEFSSTLGNIQFKAKPDENIYFQTKFPVERPVALSIRNSFNNLVSNQYQVLDDKRTVFINFMFGNNVETNKQVAANGFIFDYETRIWIFSQTYRERKLARSCKDVGI